MFDESLKKSTKKYFGDFLYMNSVNIKLFWNSGNTEHSNYATLIARVCTDWRKVGRLLASLLSDT